MPGSPISWASSSGDRGRLHAHLPSKGRGGAGAASPRPAWSPPHLHQAAYGVGTVGATLYLAPRRPPRPRSGVGSTQARVWRGHQGRTKPHGPSRLGPEASSPVAAPGSATRAPSTSKKHRTSHQGITYSRVHLGPGVPCTPRHSPGYAYPPLRPGGRPCPGKRPRHQPREPSSIL
jgi:hypothetical protein